MEPIRIVLNQTREWRSLWDVSRRSALSRIIGTRARDRFSRLTQDDWTSILLMLQGGRVRPRRARRQAWNPRRLAQDELSWSQIELMAKALRLGYPGLSAVQKFVGAGLEVMYQEAMTPTRTDLSWAFKLATDDFLAGRFTLDPELMEMLKDAFGGTEREVLEAILKEKFPYRLQKPTIRLEEEGDSGVYVLSMDVFRMLPVAMALRRLREASYDEDDVGDAREWIYTEFKGLADWYAKTIVEKLSEILAGEDGYNRISWNDFWTSYIGTQDIESAVHSIRAFLSEHQSGETAGTA